VQAPEGTPTRSVNGPAAWALVVVGGLVATLGALLPWVKVDYGSAVLIRLATRTSSYSAARLGVYGGLALVGAVVLLIAGILLAVPAVRPHRGRLGLLAVGGGAVVLFIAVLEIVMKRSRVDHLLRVEFGILVGRLLTDAELVRVKTALESLGFSISLGLGIFLAPIGGILGVIGGVMTAGTTGPRETKGRALDPNAGFDPPLTPR
jgi:hypothetical protein